jgi:hypothetical protein
MSDITIAPATYPAGWDPARPAHPTLADYIEDRRAAIAATAAARDAANRAAYNRLADAAMSELDAALAVQIAPPQLAALAGQAHATPYAASVAYDAPHACGSALYQFNFAGRPWSLYRPPVAYPDEPLYLSGPYGEAPLRADHTWEDLLDALTAMAPVPKPDAPTAADDEDEIEIPF